MFIITMIVPYCTRCAHFSPVDGKPSCPAFSKIPDDILSNVSEHGRIRQDQSGSWFFTPAVFWPENIFSYGITEQESNRIFGHSVSFVQYWWDEDKEAAALADLYLLFTLRGHTSEADRIKKLGESINPEQFQRQIKWFLKP